MTIDEYILLKSTLHAIDNRDFICGECLGKYSDRPKDGAAMLEKLRQSKGCEQPRNVAIHSIDALDGKERIAFTRCIGNFFSNEAVTLLEMQRQFEKGVLPFTGCLADQPNKVIEAFNVIRSYQIDRTERERKRLESEAKRRGRK